MKKVKNITLGDKVFAKVKGYPAWPARVEEYIPQGKKYKVYFYGTGETGIVKPEDIFGYLDHKEQFMKHAKRKDYNEAMAQIEAAIADDENIVEEDAEEQDDSTITPSDKEEVATTINRGIKRKTSVDSTNSEHKRKVPRTTNKTSKVEVTKSSTDESMLSDEENDSNLQDQSKNNNFSQSTEDSSSEEEETTYIPDYDKMDSKPTKFNVVTPQTLRDIIAQFEDYVKDAEKGNEKPEDDPYSDAQNEILLVRVTEDKLVGIKLNRNRPDKSFETEIERLRWKESDARTALELKEKIEEGLVNPEDEPELFEFDLDLSDLQKLEAIRDRIMERKKTKLKFLKIEAHLVELDAAIKTNLALDKAQPKIALQDLEIMSTLNIDPLMLKKHSHVMEMVKRLRRYIGNVKDWNLDERELEEFNKDAEKIRSKAESVYSKFKALYTVPENKLFWDFFQEECNKFKTMTKDMNENQMFILCSEPGTKQARWDELDDQEEMKFINVRNIEQDDKKVQENKENSSQVINTANSDESFADISPDNDSHG